MPEGSDENRPAAPAFQCRASAFTQLREIFGADVGEYVMFPVPPQIFDRAARTVCDYLII
jgi:hypothetical protein